MMMMMQCYELSTFLKQTAAAEILHPHHPLSNSPLLPLALVIGKLCFVSQALQMCV